MHRYNILLSTFCEHFEQFRNPLWPSDFDFDSQRRLSVSSAIVLRRRTVTLGFKSAYFTPLLCLCPMPQIHSKPLVHDVSPVPFVLCLTRCPIQLASVLYKSSLEHFELSSSSLFNHRHYLASITRDPTVTLPCTSSYLWMHSVSCVNTNRIVVALGLPIHPVRGNPSAYVSLNASGR